MKEPAIVIQQLRKTVGASFSLGPVSLVVPRGTVCALVGPNGAGKTTLLNLLMGVSPCSSAPSNSRPAWVWIFRATYWLSSSWRPSRSFAGSGRLRRALSFGSGYRLYNRRRGRYARGRSARWVA
jgi:energy-coupling factor transporter ATP-binding protein EcfA2